MPVHRHHPFSRPRVKPAFWLIYVLSVVFNFHGLLVAYSNSTYMERFATPEVIGALYTIGSALAVFAFLFISRVLRRVGNTRLTIWLAIFEIIALIVIGLGFSSATTIVAFVVFLTLNPLIYLSIDIFSETLIGDNEGSTGSKRGLALTLMSLAAVCGPLALAALVGNDNSRLPLTYFVSGGIFSLFVVIILLRFRNFTDPQYKEVDVLAAVHNFWHNNDIRNVFFSHFTLQIFFAWMVIYFPLYLATEIGLAWDAIGSIIAVGLFAYVLLEYPIGILADKYWGEKEMMAVGFVIIAICSAAVTFSTTAPIWGWMLLMFCSRVGAALVEATTESYFFKHTGGGDVNTMAFFRLTRPLATVIGALSGAATLLFLPFELIFVVLGLMMLPGIMFTRHLHDTK